MLDLIGTMLLTAAIAVNLNAAIVMMPLSPAGKLKLSLKLRAC
jgi:hypothetical protein